MEENSEMNGSKRRKRDDRKARRKTKRLLKLKSVFATRREHGDEPNSKKGRISKKKKTVPIFNDDRLGGQPVLNKRLTGGRLKPRQTQEGIFLKGLRTDFIKRDFRVSETNKARKNEDINRIIDIGRVFVKKGSKSSAGGSRRKPKPQSDKSLETVGKSSSIFEVEKDLGGSQHFTDFERCSLSPISFTCEASVRANDNEEDNDDDLEGDDSPRPGTWMTSAVKDRRRKPEDPEKLEIDFLEEFEKFARKLEENVEREILERLPGEGIVEAALESLRSLCLNQGSDEVGDVGQAFAFPIAGATADTEPRPEGNLPQKSFLSGYELIRQTTNQNWLQHATARPTETTARPNTSPSTAVEVFTPGNWTTSKKDSPRPVGLTSLEVDNHNFDFLEIDDRNFEPLHSDLAFDERLPGTSQEPETELNFVTPPIQFYPRNMF